MSNADMMGVVHSSPSQMGRPPTPRMGHNVMGGQGAPGTNTGAYGGSIFRATPSQYVNESTEFFARNDSLQQSIEGVKYPPQRSGTFPMQGQPSSMPSGMGPGAGGGSGVGRAMTPGSQGDVAMAPPTGRSSLPSTPRVNPRVSALGPGQSEMPPPPPPAGTRNTQGSNAAAPGEQISQPFPINPGPTIPTRRFVLV